MFFASSSVVLCLALNALAYPLEVVEAEDGEAFALVPLSRVRRADLYGNFDLSDPGRAIVGLKGTPINTETHRLDADFFATKNIKHHSPISKGLEASYQHLPTKSNFDISAVNTPQYGTDFKASGRYNYFQNRDTNANVEGFYERHYGGRQGTGHADRGIMFNFRRDF